MKNSKTKAVLLLHGYATTKDDFISLIPHIQEKYDYICNENYPGHGGKDHLKEFNAIDTIIWCIEKAKYLFENYDEIDLIGFSMGGALATMLTSKFSFHKVILLAPANKYLNAKVEFSRFQIYTSYLSSTLKKQDVKHGKQSLKEIKEAMKENDKRSMEMGLKVLLPNYTKHSLTEFASVIRYCNEKIKNKSFDVPCLILYGSVDQLVPESSIKLLEKTYSHHEFKSLIGISHLMLGSKNNEELISNIISFIDQE